MNYLILLGRLLFTLIFFTTIPSNFSKEKIKNVAAAGLPMASFLVPASSAMAFMGAVSVLLGIYGRIGACLLIIFLLPVTFIQHKFWTIEDPVKRRMQYINFMKNIALVGGSLFIVAYGTGLLSLDAFF